VLGPLLGIGQQLVTQGHVLGRRGPAAAGSSQGPDLDLAAVQANQNLGRGAGHHRLGKFQVEHVGRRVGHAQHAVDVEGVDLAARHIEALRVHHLKGVPGPDVFLDLGHPGQVVGLAGARGGRQDRLGPDVQIQRRQALGRRGQALADLVHLGAGLVVGLARILFRHVDRGDDLQRAAQVVEHHHGVGQGESTCRAGPARRARSRAGARSGEPCRSPGSPRPRRRSAAAPGEPRRDTRPSALATYSTGLSAWMRSSTRKPAPSGFSTSTCLPLERITARGRTPAKL
jgi:hypothetical protein